MEECRGFNSVDDTVEMMSFDEGLEGLGVTSVEAMCNWFCLRAFSFKSERVFRATLFF